MADYFVLWEGTIPISGIKISHDLKNNFRQQHPQERDRVWLNEKAKFDHIFDGELVYVKNLINHSQGIEKSILVETGKMMYSDVVLAIRSEQIRHEFGSFAFYSIIRRAQDEKILIGIKSAKSQVEAGTLGFVGGLFDLRDFEQDYDTIAEKTRTSLIRGIQREVHEECGLSLLEDSLRARTIIQDPYGAGIILIVEGYVAAEELKGSRKIVEDDMEWEAGSLNWMNEREIVAWERQKQNFAVKYFVDHLVSK